MTTYFPGCLCVTNTFYAKMWIKIHPVVRVMGSEKWSGGDGRNKGVNPNLD